MRLATRIALLCAAAVLPSLGVQAWHEASLREARKAEIRAEAERFALQSALELERVLDGAEQVLRAVGVIAARRGPGAACTGEMAELRQRIGRYVAITYADEAGTVLCGSEGTRPISLADRPYFQQALATGRRAVGQYQVSRSTGVPVLAVALPISVDAETRFVAVASFDLGWLSANLAGNLAMPEGGSITVADRDGIILGRTPQPERFVGTRIPDPFLHLLTAPRPGAIEVTSQDGTRRVLGFVPVDAVPVGLYVSAGFATGAAHAAMDRATFRAALLILAALLSALGAAFLFGRAYLRDPLVELLATMRRWADGERGARVPVRGGWEVGRLAAGFNAMADAVTAREQAMRDSEARLAAVLAQMPIGVVLAEVPSGRLLFRNARAEALLQGSALSDGAGQDTAQASAPGSAEPTAGPPSLAEPLRRAVSEGRATEELELPLLRADGTETVISVSAAPVRAPGGPPLAVAAFLDVGARRHAERQQALLTAELRHRVKNALAVVQAVAAQTLASSTTLEEFRTSFGGRLRDLARAQDALFAADDGRVKLGWLIETALAPFAPGAISVEGPDVLLPSKQTLAMALVLHEMATNAAKHGALRPGAEGRLAVRWRRLAESGGADLALQWRESRPAEALAVPETGRGFGARLISRCVAHDLRGRAAWRVEPGELVWEVIFPVPAPAAEPALEALPA